MTAPPHLHLRIDVKISKMLQMRIPQKSKCASPMTLMLPGWRWDPEAAHGPASGACVVVWGPPTPGPAPSLLLTSWHAPAQAHGDAHLDVTLGRIPFSHCELQWFVIGMINLSEKIPISRVSSCSKSTPVGIF